MIYLHISVIVFGVALVLIPFLYQLIDINKNLDKQTRVLVQLAKILLR